jgi:tetratricopeptide (TPR) repeat protein
VTDPPRGIRPSPWLAPSETAGRIASLVLLLLVISAFGVPSPLDVLLVLLAFWVTIAVHEAGHALMALAVGHRLFEVRVGLGPTLRFHLGGTRMLFGPLPGLGYVMSLSDDARGYRLNRLIIGAAGMAVNALVLGWLFLHGIGLGFTLDLAIINALSLLGSLVPFATKTSIGPLRPDGLNLLRTVFATPADLDEERATSHAIQARLLEEDGEMDAARAELDAGLEHHPGSPMLRGWLGLHLLETRRYGEAREVFAALSDPAEDRGRTVEPHVRAAHLNNLARCDLMTGDPSALEEAEAASVRAIELLPAHPAIMSTRGFALICTGSYLEGVFLAEKAYAKHRDPKERAASAAIISIGRAMDWRFPDAERWLATAQGLDADCPLLERASQELERRKAGPNPTADLDGTWSSDRGRVAESG